ncbi:MAG: YncE family protein [Acidimicrobiales bacterium]
MTAPRRRRFVSLAVPVVLLAGVSVSGCSSLATPGAQPADSASLAPAGSMGYVVCPDALTPIELATDTSEPPIDLPITGSPPTGDFAVTATANGRWAYVVTSDGTVGRSAMASSGAASEHRSVPSARFRFANVVIPVNLVTQQSGRPIAIPGDGPTHAIVVLPGGRTVFASSGSSIVPVDVANRTVGKPIDFGAGRTVFGMALQPGGGTLYVLVSGGVFPVNTGNDAPGAEIPTGLSPSSVYSPHGIVVNAQGTMIYVVGQGGPNYGGRVVPITTAGTVLPATSFDRFGIGDPAALAIVPGGASLDVVDAANDWVNPVLLSSYLNPPDPVPLPARTTTIHVGGTRHPTDIVAGPGSTGMFIVVGFDSVVPFRPATVSFGAAIPVCSGASSMVVAPSP